MSGTPDATSTSKPPSSLRLLPLLLAATTCFIYAFITTSDHYSIRATIDELALADRIALTKKGARRIDERLRAAQRSADKISVALSAGISRVESVVILCNELTANPWMFGGTVSYRRTGASSPDRDALGTSQYLARRRSNATAFEPTPVAANSTLPATTASGQSHDRHLILDPLTKANCDPQDELREIALHQDVDYRYWEHDWFLDPINYFNDHGKPPSHAWAEPYFDAASLTNLTTYSSVFTGPDGNALGVVTVDLSIDGIGRTIEQLRLGPSGFGGLTTQEGRYLYHPRREYVAQGRTLVDLADELNDDNRRALAKAANAGEAGWLDHTSTTTGEAAWLVYEPIPTSNWSLQNTFLRVDVVPGDYLGRARCKDTNCDHAQLRAVGGHAEETDSATGDVRIAGTNDIRQQLLRACVAVVIGFLAASAWIGFRFRGSNVIRWSLSVGVAVVFLCSIGFTWRQALTYSTHDAQDGVLVYRATLEEAMRQYDANHSDVDAANHVLTGIALTSMELTRSDNLIVSGEIWQVRPTRQKDSASGARFGGATSLTFEPTTVRPRDDMQYTHITPFRSVTRVDLDVSRYPLDLGVLTLQILPTSESSNVALVPDLDSYSLLIPSNKPGIDGASLRGWRIVKSYFRLSPADTMVRKGLTNTVDIDPFPTMNFDIVVQREWIDPFISALIPVSLVVMLLFTLLVLVGRVDTGRTLSIAVGMLFVVVFSHIGVREQIAAQKWFYLELVYFVVYAAILTVTVILVVHEFRPGRNPAAASRPQLLYWPLTTGAMLIATLATFY